MSGKNEQKNTPTVVFLPYFGGNLNAASSFAPGDCIPTEKQFNFAL
jgi:hypothetical protein